MPEERLNSAGQFKALTIKLMKDYGLTGDIADKLQSSLVIPPRKEAVKKSDSPLKSIEVRWEHRHNGDWYLCIVDQSHRGRAFGHNSSDWRAPNGIKLFSSSCPEWRPSEDTLFVRGNDGMRDTKILVVSTEFKVRIDDAIAAYNKEFRRK